MSQKPSRDDLPGDDSDFEDMDSLEAIGLGILQELTLIRQALQADQMQSTNEDDTDPWVCKCSREFSTETAFKRHTYDVHDAPRQGKYYYNLAQSKPDQ